MRQAKAELYVHMVWATEGRRKLMKPPVHRTLYRCVEGQARQLGCTVLAIGGVADHIHMVLRMPTKLSVAQLVQQLKGVSSRFARGELGLAAFGWQQGYGAFNLSRAHVNLAVQYVQRQEEHHAGGKLWAQWEETCEEVGPAATRPADGEGFGGGRFLDAEASGYGTPPTAGPGVLRTQRLTQRRDCTPAACDKRLTGRGTKAIL